MKHTSGARAGITGVAIILTLVLAGCRDGSGTPSGDATTAAAPTAGTTASATSDTPGAPTIVASDDFCASAIDAVAAADDLSASMKELETAMSSGDVGALHSAGQGILDHSDQATAFYVAGAAAAGDQATKDAFNGMVSFVSDYAVKVGQAAVDAPSVPSYMGAVAAIITDPATTPLLTQAGDWATTVKDFTTEHCSLT